MGMTMPDSQYYLNAAHFQPGPYFMNDQNELGLLPVDTEDHVNPPADRDKMWIDVQTAFDAWGDDPDGERTAATVALLRAAPKMFQALADVLDFLKTHGYESRLVEGALYDALDTAPDFTHDDQHAQV